MAGGEEPEDAGELAGLNLGLFRELGDVNAVRLVEQKVCDLRLDNDIVACRLEELGGMSGHSPDLSCRDVLGSHAMALFSMGHRLQV